MLMSDCRTGERVGRSKGNGVNINDDEPRIGGTEKFRVYKVDLSNSALAELQSVGDNTLFVGYNGSISVQAFNSSKGIRPNCTYYVDLCWIGGTTLLSKGGRQVVDAGIYNLYDRSVAPWYDRSVAPWYEGGSFSCICPPLWVKL
ncbi:hypothetical protein RHMOL_Rhmol02G0286900 [Rhododendron molle]|uniref:Uncharacterized protein n=1 Tax=Rhododendron molle TaxID=49168 RepID=A0ACC0PVC4_RHOML|nr:hypothetical protein RHMOL_Rhmol02G0286900 [Rhododendron molle]